MIHPSIHPPQGRPAKEVSNGSANDVCQSMKQSIVGRVPVLGTLGFVMSEMLVADFFFRYQSRKEKPGKVLKLDDFLRILPLGNHVFSPFWENMLYMLELFPRILSKSKKKGLGWWRKTNGLRRGVFFVWEVSNIDVWSTRHPVTVSTGQDYYIFSRESLYTFICNTYWVGSRSDIHYFYHYLRKMNRFWLIYVFQMGWNHHRSHRTKIKYYVHWKL